jgi:hypothetical protein
MEALNKIQEKDPDFYRGLSEFIEYLATTYDDKYEVKPNFSLDYSYHKQLGKGANVFTIAKYLQRYSTEGFAKSNQVVDLYKLCHYAMFEIVRRNLDN